MSHDTTYSVSSADSAQFTAIMNLLVDLGHSRRQLAGNAAALVGFKRQPLWLKKIAISLVLADPSIRTWSDQRFEKFVAELPPCEAWPAEIRVWAEALCLGQELSEKVQ